MNVVSNDPDEPEILVQLQGEALIPPEIHVTPPEIHTALPPGGNRIKNLLINNAAAATTWCGMPHPTSFPWKVPSPPGLTSIWPRTR